MTVKYKQAVLYMLYVNQWRNVTKYIYLSAVFKYSYKILSISIFCYLTIPLHFILKANTVLDFATFIW